MRTSIILAAVALLTPSLAAYTCPSYVGDSNTLKCCRYYPATDCTDPSKVPEDFFEFRQLCDEDGGKSPNCCFAPPGSDRAVDCHPARPNF